MHREPTRLGGSPSIARAVLRDPCREICHRLLQPFTVLAVVLLLRVSDPIVSFNTLRIGLQLPGDLLDVVRSPASNLDKRAGAHLIESLGKDRSDPLNLFEIVFLNVLAGLG